MTTDTLLGTYFDSLYQITLQISSSLDLDDILAYLTEETTKSVDAKAASVRLVDQEGKRLEMRAVYGLSDEYLSKGPVEIARSPIDQRHLAGHPSQLEDVTQAEGFQYPQEAAREGIVSLASVPLIARGRPIGVLRVYTAHRRIFTDTEMRFLTAVADLAALAIENARLYNQMRANYEGTMQILWGDVPG